MTGRRFSAAGSVGARASSPVWSTRAGASRAATELARQILTNPQWAIRQNVRVRRTVLAEEAARYHGLTDRFDWATEQRGS